MFLGFCIGFAVAALIAFILFSFVALGIDRMVKDREFGFAIYSESEGIWKVSDGYDVVIDRVTMVKMLTPGKVKVLYSKDK